MNIEVKISKRPISYKIAMKFLHKRVEEVKSNKNKEILDKNIKIVKTNRGGKITLHNPGQKIIYFVLNLNKRKKDVRKLINVIEKSIIEFLGTCNIYGRTDKKNIGIWVNKRKIAAIGLRISRWVAYHGCSININNNLDHYLKKF